MSLGPASSREGIGDGPLRVAMTLPRLAQRPADIPPWKAKHAISLQHT
jgi:hypothetical protein